VDATSENGCLRCAFARDSLSGWGRLDVTAALQALAGPLPLADSFETNDDAGDRAATLWGRKRDVEATVDYWDDQVDVYRVKLAAGERLQASLRGPEGQDTNLVLWKPGTTSVGGVSPELLAKRATLSATSGPNERLAYRARAGGWYYVEVKIATPGAGPYTLRLTKAR